MLRTGDQPTVAYDASPPATETLTAPTVLDRVRSAKQAEARAARETLVACVDWAAIHSSDTIVGPSDTWHEQELPMGGEGAPAVAEFAVTELAAALGVSTASGRAFLSDAIELRYRLPRTYARLVAGEVLAWRARRIAHATLCLPPDGATWVDRQVAPFADSIGPVQLDRLIAQALAAFDPDQAEERRLASLPSRHVDIRLHDAATGLNALNSLNSLNGLVFVDATLDHADATALEDTIAQIAEQLRHAGSPDSLDERRATALGLLARGETHSPPGPPRPTTQHPHRRLRHHRRGRSRSTSTSTPTPSGSSTPPNGLKWSTAANLQR
ncbi:DUF222 domain-containing protein [Nocardioides sambongensis]|uniref:DUF222 domain-containing protein n=1 Tax=Nocardioides sambongensis TaxID=2589074 RepID=UPI001128DE3E|nr:DUF222 domain-containing protein [Nocardioides sambongensis]